MQSCPKIKLAPITNEVRDGGIVRLEHFAETNEAKQTASRV